MERKNKTAGRSYLLKFFCQSCWFSFFPLPFLPISWPSLPISSQVYSDSVVRNELELETGNREINWEPIKDIQVREDGHLDWGGRRKVGGESRRRSCIEVQLLLPTLGAALTAMCRGPERSLRATPHPPSWAAPESTIWGNLCSPGLPWWLRW